MNDIQKFFLRSMLVVSAAILCVYIASQFNLGVPMTSNAAIILMITDIILAGINIFIFVRLAPEVQNRWRGGEDIEKSKNVNFIYGVAAIFCGITILIYLISFAFAVIGN